jgi:hypothetical protein
VALTSEAKGYLLVNEFIRLVVLHSRGRLVAYRPEYDVHGTDIVTMLKGGFAALQFQVKGEFYQTLPKSVRMSVPLRTFEESPYRFVVVLCYLTGADRLGPIAWVVRSDEFARLAARSPKRLQFHATTAAKPKSDKWGPWRYRPREVADVAETALRCLEAEGAEAQLPACRVDVRAVQGALRRKRKIKIKPLGAASP